MVLVADQNLQEFMDSKAESKAQLYIFQGTRNESSVVYIPHHAHSCFGLCLSPLLLEMKNTMPRTASQEPLVLLETSCSRYDTFGNCQYSGAYFCCHVRSPFDMVSCQLPVR